MKYPRKYPLSRLFSYLGATLTIKIDVVFDKEANVFVATSKDVPGLVLEAESFNDLKREIEEAVPNLLNVNNNNHHSHSERLDLIVTDHIAIA